MYELNYPKSLYVDSDPHEGDRDNGVRNVSIKLVTVRKYQDCASMDKNHPHQIAPGKMARFEKAIVDGKWGAYYMCIPCMEQWFREEGIGEV